MMIKELTFEQRFHTALSTEVPEGLRDLAGELKAEGRTQSEIYDLYLHQLRKHIGAAEGTSFDAISETMDVIAGHCDRSQWLFDRRM